MGCVVSEGSQEVRGNFDGLEAALVVARTLLALLPLLEHHQTHRLVLTRHHDQAARRETVAHQAPQQHLALPRLDVQQSQSVRVSCKYKWEFIKIKSWHLNEMSCCSRIIFKYFNFSC